jgi:hypothetical protein
MFATTLRIEDDLGRFLQEAARRGAQSVNAFLAELLRQERDRAIRQGWASDWAAYAQDDLAQDVSYALAAQAELVAEPTPKPYRSPKGRKR